MAASSSKNTKLKGGKSAGADKNLCIQLYKEMIFSRRFEEKVNQAYTKGKFSGFCHLYIGQEALGVGVQACLKPEDYMLSGYRSHTQAFGKGITPYAVMAELFGKEDGCSRGKGGSMHMFSKEHRFLGGHGIVGGQVPLAAGVGFTIRYNEKDDICVCYLGDAATNQGQFFEALNMAATWSLPVLFIIENNKYGMGTDITRTTSVDHLYKRALAFDMDHSDVDAMNVITVHDHVKPIVDTMRKDKRPYLLEAKTYRYRGHSVSDPAAYRTKDEVKEYQSRGPLVQMKQHLMDEFGFAEEELKSWDKEIKEQVKEIEAKADAAPFSDAKETWMHNYV